MSADVTGQPSPAHILTGSSSGSSNGSNSSRHMSSTNYLHKEPAIWSDAVRTFNSHPHRLVGVPLLAEVVLPLAKYHHHAGCLNSLMYSAPSNWL